VAERSEKFLINNNDQCVGRTSTNTLSVQTLSGGAVVNEEPLPPYPGGNSWAYAINDAAMVAGAVSAGMQEPAVWYRHATRGWVVLQLGFPGTDNMGRATDISEPDATGRIRVTGYTMDTNICCSPGSRREAAVRWTLQADGVGGWQVVAAEALGSVTTKGRTTNSWGRAVNNAGNVAGHAGEYFESGSAATWPVGSGMETLPALNGGTQSRAVDINNLGWIVGTVWDNGNNCDRAAIWRPQ
jgi:uncharacterized membrane protein